MTERLIPTAMRPSVEGPFERAMALGVRVPGKIGYIARRKLKRRQCARMQDTFSEVLADTRAGDLCIDLGANIGEITCRMAATGADVISFEPDPGAFEALQAATVDLPNVTLVHKAAGHKEDSLLLHRSARWSPDDPSGHTQGSSLVHSEEGADASNAIRVEVVDIIAYLESLDRDIRILKMDIEGAEWDIMTRLIDHPLLSRIDCIFVETHERQDPARYVPVFEALQDRAEQITKPYINLYWV
ncbi:MAG: FkbM family methyltransferase [Tateyamaria sp.]|uniref:FkbM family methyltransferase n=2 Tax=Tateyamaria sp. TaxID=1929288 RepID=UPI00327A640D